MVLNLDLTNVPSDYQQEFCDFIVAEIRKNIQNNFPFQKCENIEKYIEENSVINWQNKRNDFISVYNIYRLAVENLKIKQIRENYFSIFIDNNINIPNSYTKLHSIVALLEYGTLSIRGCRVLSEVMKAIADSLTTYYHEFRLGE